MKQRNKIDIDKAVEIFEEAYGIKAKVFNFYQLRLRTEEINVFWDWYHTTGSLVENRNGSCYKTEKKFSDTEDIAIYILERKHQLLTSCG